MPGCGKRRGLPAPPFLPVGALPPPHFFPPSPVPSPPGGGRGRGAPSGPHESGAAAGGRYVSALPALRVRKPDGGPLQRGIRGGWVAFGGWVVKDTGLPRRPASGVPSLFPQSAVSPPVPRGGRPRSLLSFPRFPTGSRGVGEEKGIRLRPQIRRDNPLNLSILLSGGKETNQDSLSSGERRGKSPAPNPRPTGGRGKCGV